MVPLPTVLQWVISVLKSLKWQILVHWCTSAFGITLGIAATGVKPSSWTHSQPHTGVNTCCRILHHMCLRLDRYLWRHECLCRHSRLLGNHCETRERLEEHKWSPRSRGETSRIKSNKVDSPTKWNGDWLGIRLQYTYYVNVFPFIKQLQWYMISYNPFDITSGKDRCF